MSFAIRVYKEYFNFSASHFMMFEDGTREPLHGHNYRIKLEGKARDLKGDMVFDFLHIKPIVREICDSLDHKLLIPGRNKHLQLEEDKDNTILRTKTGYFSIPTSDVLVMDIDNSSAECLALYLNEQIQFLVKERFQYDFDSLTIEVEETPGQAAIYQSEKSL